MSQKSKAPNSIPWPPIILVCALAIGFILNGVLPLGFPKFMFGEMLFAIGCMAIIIALLIDVSAMHTLYKAQTTIMPHKAS